ncbi:MAG: hypothetical protein IJM66_01310 [Muribaculaceae bacterium]|nr:hypothetical protein [Muribaculaceae bacterium]
MKKAIFIICVAIMTIAVTGCNENKGTKFAPKERESKISDDERSSRIAQKRASLNTIEGQLYNHGVKFSILEPKTIGNDITPEIAQMIGVKMLHIASQNGISGLGTAPGFVLGTEIMQTGRAATGTAPQKMTVQYTLTFKVMNTATGDVYATATQDIVGVGNSFAEANINAVKNIKNTSAMQQMLSTASDRIIDWYNNNVGTLKAQVEGAAGKGDYALALAIVESVPEQAKAAFEWASQRQPDLYAQWTHKVAADNLAALQSAIATANDDFDPAVGGHFKLIPTDAPEFAKAQELYNAYQEKVKVRRADLEARAERDAAAQREWDMEKAKMDHETELVQIEADKMKCKYQSQANAVAMEKAMRAESDAKHKSFWGKLGDRIIGGIDFVGDKVSSLEWND